MNNVAQRAAASDTGIGPEAFRALMRRLVGGVAVITSACGGAVNGMTATAVCSVSAEPPLVLAVVNRNSSSHGLIAEGGVFALNILGAGQAELANYFAGKDGKNFEAVAHRIGQSGCPLIEGCTAIAECRLEGRHDVGSHTIFIGRVIHSAEAAMAPLAYHDARFCTLKAI